MADPRASDHRLEELRRRWQADPTSRVFVQLAEEYRRRGEAEEAHSVLEEGLEHHPSYLSAKVALARCELDLNRPEAAMETLAGVLERDPTHLLAGKLAIEAHLERGDEDAAREALDRYRLLGGPEEEVQDLEARLATGRPGGAPDALPPSGTTPREPEGPQGEQAEAGPSVENSASRKDEVDGELFDLPAPRRGASWPQLDGRLGRSLQGALEQPPIHLEDPNREARYLEGLATGEVLGVEPAPEEPTPVPEPTPAHEPTPASEPAHELEAGPALTPQPVPEAAATAPAPPEATATLGDLYLRQGYLGEAEAIYRDVLRREPEHEAAARGLATLRLRRQSWLAAREVLGDEEPPASLTARKKVLLLRYLAWLKEGVRDVPR